MLRPMLRWLSMLPSSMRPHYMCVSPRHVEGLPYLVLTVPYDSRMGSGAVSGPAFRMTFRFRVRVRVRVRVRFMLNMAS